MDSLDLGDIWLFDKTGRNLVEWDTFRLYVVVACNGQKSCDKSMAQQFWTAILRAMGNTNNPSAQFEFQLLGFETKFVPFFFLQVPTLKKECVSIFLGFIWREAFYKMFVLAGVTTKCCADGTSHPETRTSRVGFGFLWAKGTLSMDFSNLGETWLLAMGQRR